MRENVPEINACVGEHTAQSGACGVGVKSEVGVFCMHTAPEYIENSTGKSI
ncbi:MAG: hypothetical protein SCH70_14535 [Candidatus Methanoperedens sp.]|nr:hypothetical protein [Candidatus Methanoperedens sp.]